MSDWLHGLPVLWMAVVVFGATYLVAGVIYAAVNVLAAGERGRAFKAISPGLLSPLGVLFGLLSSSPPLGSGVTSIAPTQRSIVKPVSSVLLSFLRQAFPASPRNGCAMWCGVTLMRQRRKNGR